MAGAGEEMALQPQQLNRVFISCGFMTRAHGKLVKDFWELHSKFLWENTNTLEILLSKAGNVHLHTSASLSVQVLLHRTQTLL